jgi:hypothetical protein
LSLITPEIAQPWRMSIGAMRSRMTRRRSMEATPRASAIFAVIYRYATLRPG